MADGTWNELQWLDKIVRYEISSPGNGNKHA